MLTDNVESTTCIENAERPTVWAHRNSLFLWAFFTFLTYEVIMKKIGIIMGSDSDLPVVQKAAAVLKELGIEYEAHVYSAHRTPEEAAAWTKAARGEGFGVIIAFAGMAAHLAGAIAANTTLPVIGVPCKSAALEGMDALLATVMMPSGIPVATVAIDGGKNAALLAAEMIALSDPELADALDSKRAKEAAAVLEKDKGIEERL